MWKKIFPYIISVLISSGIGALAGYLTKDSVEIYLSLNKPPLSPPSEIFPIVWSILFVLMGISAALVWCSNGHELDGALIFYALQLTLNFVWSLIFFNFQAYLPAFLLLLLLLVLILITVVKFYRVRPLSAYLMLPYLLWVIFAGYLNLAIYYLN